MTASGNHENKDQRNLAKGDIDHMHKNRQFGRKWRSYRGSARGAIRQNDGGFFPIDSALWPLRCL